MTVANALTDLRTKTAAPSKSRRRCYCGCNKRATHAGQANGVNMVLGCELSVARWVKSPAEHIRASARALYAQRNGGAS